MNDNIGEERWRAVVGFEGLYEVSDHGRVRSVERVQAYERVLASGRVVRVDRKLKSKLLRPGTVKSGHQLVVLGRGHSKLVHALVLSAFVGPRPAGHDSCHFDGDPANNRLANLRWGTRSENVRDAQRHGTYRGGAGHGEAHPRALLNEAAVLDIRAANDVATADLADKYGVSRSAIKAARSGKTWGHLAGEAA